MGILRDLHQCAVIFCFNLVHVSRTCWCGNIKLQLFELGKIHPRCLRIVYEDLVHPPASVLFNQLWFSFAERPSPKAQAMFASILTPCLNPKTSAVVFRNGVILQLSCLAPDPGEAPFCLVVKNTLVGVGHKTCQELRESILTFEDEVNGHIKIINRKTHVMFSPSTLHVSMLVNQKMTRNGFV